MLTSLLRIFLTRSFKPFVFKGKYENKLSFENLNNLGLYVHIPFCRSLCGFCPYCKEVYDTDRALIYKDALLKEIDLTCKDMKAKKAVSSLYFGGGTPALLVDGISDIIRRLTEYFDIAGGIGVELHPDDITEDTLFKLKSAGISMLSIGIQSFDESSLKKIGRCHDSMEKKFELIKKYSFSVVDVDLIFGIPGQDKNLLSQDIITAFKYGATQVSTYPFIDFTFANNQYKPLSQKRKREMLRRLNELSEKLGLKRTSVWTFAKSNTEKYSSVTRDAFLGFGVSAASLLKDSFKINTFSVKEYIQRVNSLKLPTSLTLDFTKRQRAVYYLFWNAYGLQIDPGKFFEMFGTGLEKMFGFEIMIARAFKLIAEKKGKYYLTEKASYMYHYIEQRYTTAYIDKMWNICGSIAFPDKIVLK